MPMPMRVRAPDLDFPRDRRRFPPARHRRFMLVLTGLLAISPLAAAAPVKKIVSRTCGALCHPPAPGDTFGASR